MKTFSEKFAEITYNPFWSAIVIHWKGHSSVEEHQSVYNSALEAVMCFGAKCLVSDMSASFSVSNIVSEWIKDEFIPKLTNYGVKKVAILSGGNSAHKHYLESIKKTCISNGLILKIFNNRFEMEDWLKDYELIKKPSVSVTDASKYVYFL